MLSAVGCCPLTVKRTIGTELPRTKTINVTLTTGRGIVFRSLCHAFEQDAVSKKDGAAPGLGAAVCKASCLCVDRSSELLEDVRALVYAVCVW
jgi:hypothetical protein